MMKYCLALCITLAALVSTARASIVVIPSYLFLDSKHRTLPVTVSNDGDDEREVWLEVKYGYETSDDSGNIFIQMDSLAVGEPSSAQWLQGYPRRFILKPGESQIVRLVVTPPAGLADGEYWSRLLVESKPRNILQKPQTPSTAIKPGIVLLYEQSVPFHYRVGKLSTEIVVDSIRAVLADSSIDVYTKCSKTGNAAYWGSRTVRVLDKSGKVVQRFTHNTGVFKNITLLDQIDRKSLAPGDYTVTLEFVTEGRTDIPRTSLVHANPVRISTTFTIP